MLSLAFALFTASAETATCIDDFQEKGSVERGGRGKGDQILAYWKENQGQAHLLCESAEDSDGKVTRVTAEFREAIGFKTGWQSANPLGQTNFGLVEVNGVAQNEDTQGTITTVESYKEYKVCGDGESGSEIQFGKAMAVQNVLPGGTTLTAYAFKNDEAKSEILNGTNLFSIDASMLGCKMEVVVAFPVPDSGNLTFTVEVRVERDEGESALNAGLTKDESTDQIVVSTNEDGVAKEVLSMAKGVVCKATGTAVDQNSITIVNNDWPNDTQFSYTVARAAVENCEFVYWDPLMTPFGGADVYEGKSGLSTGAIIGISIAAVGVVGLAAFLICCYCKKSGGLGGSALVETAV